MLLLSSISTLSMEKVKRKFNPAADDHNWSVLFATHMANLQQLGAVHPMWQEGYDRLCIDPAKRPREEKLSAVLRGLTGFELVQTGASVIMEQIDWYTCLAAGQLPCTCFVRTPEELNYCDEPDYWHDVMGHAAFLAIGSYAEMYRLLAVTYVRAFRENRTDILPTLDFIGGLFIELGLIREPSGLKAFGATFYSSGEVAEAFRPEHQVMFTDEALRSGETYDRHKFQGKYYVFRSMEQVTELIRDVALRLDR